MMTHRLLNLLVGSLVASTAMCVHAQGLRLATPPPGASQIGVSQRPADYIVAVVNSEPITNHQVRQEIQRVARQLAQAQQPAPDARELASQALERLINDRAQLQLARESGIKIDEAAINEAEQTVARQNQLEMAEVFRRLAADGIERSQFRNQLRDQLLLTRLREREVNQKVRIAELEIDQYLLEQQKNQDDSAVLINIAHVLVALPDDANAAQIAVAQNKAQRVLERARLGEDFAALARQLSNAPDASAGGQLGLRRADRYPALFVEAMRDIPAGGLSVVQSGAGIHVLKVIEKRSSAMPATSVEQTRVSHILLRLSAELDEVSARDKLSDFRKRILAGQADFATLAKLNSHDASATQGGDLGWASAGQFVPEFEEVMNSLSPGQVSAPFTSRFGAHLIEVKERRSVQLSQREQREAVRALLREKKLEEAFLTWTRDLRGRAYVEMREPPG